MAWLVVGANGQLGKSVCEVLEERGIDFVRWNREYGSVLLEGFVSTYVDEIKP